MWGASSPFRSAGALATLSITRMSSQRYLPHYPAIHSEAPRKVPAQRSQLMIIWRLAFAQSGVNRPARKSALIPAGRSLVIFRCCGDHDTPADLYCIFTI